MTVEKFPIPDYFTPEWYAEQKELRRNDFEIAEELMISKQLLDVWKRKCGCVGLITKPLSGRKPKGDIQLAIQLVKEGKSQRQASRETNISKMTLSKYLKLEGVLN